MVQGASAAVELDGVSKVFGQGSALVRALSAVTLRVLPGEVLFVTGPSGSGKTTLISIIGGVLRASAGTVRVRGHDLDTLSPAELVRFRLHEVGFVFQGSNLIAALPAVDNVSVPLWLADVPGDAAEERAARDLARVGLGGALGRKPGQLSGGERQRVAIARAVVMRPPLLLADEPTANLDAHTGQQVMALLAEVATELDHTLVVVTHDTRIFGFATRILAMEDGRIVGEGLR